MSMQRLVTQFDDTRTRATVATPTCSSCCCCCCCVATVLSASTVTAMNVSELGQRKAITHGRRRATVIMAFLALPIALAAGIASAFVVQFFAIGVMAVLWILMLRPIYRSVGLNEPSKVIEQTVFLGTGLFIAELIGGGALVLWGVGSDGSSGGIVIYFVLAAVMAWFFIALFRRFTHAAITPLAVSAGSPAEAGLVESGQPTEPTTFDDNLETSDQSKSSEPSEPSEQPPKS